MADQENLASITETATGVPSYGNSNPSPFERGATVSASPDQEPQGTGPIVLNEAPMLMKDFKNWLATKMIGGTKPSHALTNNLIRQGMPVHYNHYGPRPVPYVFLSEVEEFFSKPRKWVPPSPVSKKNRLAEQAASAAVLPPGMVLEDAGDGLEAHVSGALDEEVPA